MDTEHKKQTNLEWLQSLDAEGYLKVFDGGVFCDMFKGECTAECDKCLRAWFDLPHEEAPTVDGYQADCVIFDELHPLPPLQRFLQAEKNPFMEDA